MAKHARKRVPAPIFPEHRDDPLGVRGISTDVIDGAYGKPRYVSFAKGDWLQVCRWLPGIHDSTWTKPKQYSWLKGFVSSSPGIIIVRRSLTDFHFDNDNPEWNEAQGKWNPWRAAEQPMPYLRFDKAVPTDAKGNRLHYINHPEAGASKRLDIHPMARDLLKNAIPHKQRTGEAYREAWFCLEGTLKGDAVLSAGGLAISVPGVTMWDVPEDDWLRYAKHLRNLPRVHVTPDSDYWTNPSVAINAWACVQEWRSRGVNADLAVPPTVGALEKTGVDDYLAAGGTLDGMRILPGVIPVPPELTKGTAKVFVWLTTKRGGYFGRYHPLAAAKDLGVHRDTVRRARLELEAKGIVRFDLGKPFIGATGQTHQGHTFTLV